MDAYVAWAWMEWVDEWVDGWMNEWMCLSSLFLFLFYFLSLISFCFCVYICTWKETISWVNIRRYLHTRRERPERLTEPFISPAALLTSGKQDKVYIMFFLVVCLFADQLLKQILSLVEWLQGFTYQYYWSLASYRDFRGKAFETQISILFMGSVSDTLKNLGCDYMLVI